MAPHIRWTAHEKHKVEFVSWSSLPSWWQWFLYCCTIQNTGTISPAGVCLTLLPGLGCTGPKPAGSPEWVVGLQWEIPVCEMFMESSYKIWNGPWQYLVLLSFMHVLKKSLGFWKPLHIAHLTWTRWQGVQILQWLPQFSHSPNSSATLGFNSFAVK